MPVGHIWNFDLEEYELRNFGRKFNFSKIRMEPVMLNFLAKTENLRNRRSEQPIYIIILNWTRVNLRWKGGQLECPNGSRELTV